MTPEAIAPYLEQNFLLGRRRRDSTPWSYEGAALIGMRKWYMP